ncbi:Protein CBG23327 [Caenorhabditis briggsae]|uniref:Protein CBG23327 n=1 Tax=Caenorhabditis briggsae TaxID=6238 RepID=A8Y466_CAEBR|nr:Protein CBG23327 [Caenorhabditis briggsae]CAP39686.2 Protein CBG23327 [Caenorhabditis briggsae]
MSSLQYAYEQQQLDFLHICSMGDETRVRDALLSGRVDINYRHKSNGWCAQKTKKNCEQFSNWEKSEKIWCRVSYFYFSPPPNPTKVSDSASRRTSDASDQASPGFIPNYVRHPPFPYAMKNSFDNFSSPPATSGSNGSGSPGPLNSPTYSYGRRDSFNKTRFLLVRTSVEKGKETYKRVTLPGGSDVERLKTTIEKACKGRAVDMIFTLPENDLVETIEQIHQFKDCQKIDVIFKDAEKEATPEVVSFRREMPPATARVSLSPFALRSMFITSCAHGHLSLLQLQRRCSSLLL